MSETPLLDWCGKTQYEYRRNYTQGRSKVLAWLVDYKGNLAIAAKQDKHAPQDIGNTLLGYPLYVAPDAFGQPGEHIRFLPEAEIREKLEITGWL